MSDSPKYSKADKKHDKHVIDFGLIKVLYRNEQINIETYKAITKHLGKDIVEGHLSSAYYGELNSKFQAEQDGGHTLSEIEQMFIRVENGELMVTAACEQLKIGRSTYYRKYRKWKATQPPVEEDT